MMKNIVVRALSGAVYVALVLFSLLYRAEFMFPLLCAVFALLASVEFYRMVKPADTPRALHLLDIAVVTLMPMLFLFSWPVYDFILILLGLLFMTRFIAQLYVKGDNVIVDFSLSVMGWIYVGVPLMLGAAVASIFSARLILLALIMIWINDTGAFLVGMTIGRRRLFPRLSPKKSWEGFWGGFIFSCLAGVAACHFFSSWFNLSDNYLFFVILGAVVSVAATFGDLFESMIKRTYGVKDSGKIMPGHGGILDRIDSLLFVLPAVAIPTCLFIMWIW